MWSNSAKPVALIHGLKGVAIGMANMIPGVSGGTLAVMTGIYDDLVDAFGNFFSRQGGWKHSIFFLGPVFLGVLTGNFVLASIVGWLFETAPAAANFGFIGLILGSLPYIVRQAAVQSFRLRYLPLFCIGFAAVLVMGLASSPGETPPITDLSVSTALFITAAAFVAGIAMVIPGVSGSFLLVLTGMYSTLQHGFRSMNIPVILLFVIGTVISVILTSKGIAALLRHFHCSTYSVITGLVTGSAFTLFPGFSSGPDLIINILALTLGVVLSLVLGTGMKERLRIMRHDG